jgi:hypothetical protein
MAIASSAASFSNSSVAFTLDGYGHLYESDEADIQGRP